MRKTMRVLLVAEHASSKFGGEAALPLHYYRVLRARGVPVWLLVHERTRNELSELFPDDIGVNILFIPDTLFHRYCWQFGRLLPARIASFTVGFAMRIYSQILQRRIIKELVVDQQISVIHQPMPVSPKEPSLIYDMGAPVIIGPMNGGMDYPVSFRRLQGRIERISLFIGRRLSNLLNTVFPGKRRAALLLVANERTKQALPDYVRESPVKIIVENGVDLTLWKKQIRAKPVSGNPTRFVYMGRLVDWKAVDILIFAFAEASRSSNICLTIIGDGVERENLQNLAKRMNVLGDSKMESKVHFAGWLSQAECAMQLLDADVLVLPSLMECGGAVVLEAMAMSMPVIATKWGGPVDYLDENCGILIEPVSRDFLVENIASAMINLAESPEKRLLMGEVARQRIEMMFDWELKVDEMLDLYQQVA